MAGVLLLISKKKANKRLFIELTKRLQKFLHTYLNGYFQNTSIKIIDDQICLIQFRNQDNGQYYSDHQGNWLTFEGIVFDLTSTKMLNAKRVFEIYLKKGVDFLNHLDGHFVIKLYDSRTNRIIVCNDYIKNKTNYIVENDDFILFTPYLATSGILQNIELDLEAFNEFMWRYYILSKRTILKNVRRLSPATIYFYDIQSEKLEVNNYWEWPHQYSDISFDNTIEKTVASMRETAQLINQSFEKPCIDFTMGQDSRQVISAFTNQDLPLATAIFGKSDFYEVIKVGELARKYQIENHNVQLDSNYSDHLYSHFKKAILLGNCEQPGYLLSRILFMRSQYAQWGNVSLNGIDGHFYKNGLWDEQYTMNLYREPRSFNVDIFLKLRALSNNYSDDIFEEHFKSIKNNSKEYFRELISESIKTHLDSPVSIQIDKFDLQHWLNFGIAANNATLSILPHLSPLLLRRNLEFALTVPLKWKFNLSKYQRAVVYALDPLLAAEKTDFAGVNMVPKNILSIFPFYLRYFYFQSSRMRNKIKSKLGLRVVTHLQEAWDYQPLYQKLFWDSSIQNLLSYETMQLSNILIKDRWVDQLKIFREQKNTDLKSLEFFLKITSVEQFLQFAQKI